MDYSWLRWNPPVLALMLIYFVFLLAVSAQQDTPSSKSCTGPQDWQCTNGNCILENWLCDGQIDCLDGSDEMVSVCDARPCDDDQYECSSNKKQYKYPKCIPLQFLCDGDADCLGEEDEAENCGTSLPQCTTDEFNCEDDTGCIPKERRCDHLRDCLNGKDEGESCAYPDCTADQFKCRNDFCINKTLECDGNWDCRDGSDESEMCTTPPPTCAPGFWACDNGRCISMNSVCNDQDDCGTGYDERQAGLCDSLGRMECADQALNNCSHSCEQLLVGYQCSCPSGYQLKDDGRTCRDIDECEEYVGKCSQICNNVNGTYECDCTIGYKGVDDTMSRCAKADGVVPYLIYSNRFYINKLGRDGTDFERLSDYHELTIVLDFDYNDSTIYYSDAAKNSLSRMLFNGTHLSIVSEHFAAGVEGISVDWIGRKLYWTSSRQQGLYVSELNGTNIHVLVAEGSPMPRAIAVYPAKGMLFWTDWNIQPFISRAGMDGQGAVKIITDGLFWPNGLTIDYVSNKMWWIDAHLDMIEFADLDGTNRHIVTTKVSHPFAITIFEDDMYWTEWNLKRIEKANRFDGSNRTILKETSLQPFDIHIVHPLRQPYSPNPCGDTNGGCSHLCLIAMGGSTSTCACPFEFILDDDNKTCISNCTSMQFECDRTDHKCIPHTWLCDGHNDCKGGEDETNCSERRCDGGQFQCGTNITQCVSNRRLCDTFKHCSDGSDEEIQMCAATLCRPWQFRCASGQCVLKQFTCDRSVHCADGSDEAPINTDCRGNGTCAEGEFKCDNSRCIPSLWFCDWDDDCGDRSDEPGHYYCYRNTSCPAGWVRCKKNYRCIPSTAHCDGKDDCRDMTDESLDMCPNCDDGEYTCDNSRCVPLRWVCDFADDCGDNSDENTDTHKCIYRNCTQAEYRCKNQKCISKSFLCDGEDDCGDGSDEDIATCKMRPCPETKFKCASGHCISRHLLCDGWRHCDDGSDEQTCPTRFPGGRYCPHDTFECDTHVCILPILVCDGNDDCGDESDESAETCHNMSCNTATKFQCDNGKCIPRYKLCNGNDDCNDGSDENNITLCGHKKPNDTCKYFQYKCHNGECIEIGKVCDGTNDCLDSTDEKVCTATGYKTCGDGGTGPCQQTCRNFDRGHLCTCVEGYMLDLDDKVACLDIDECASWGHYCPQICINTKGSYSCKCLEGFLSVHKNDTICRAPDNGDQFRSKSMVLFSKGNEIRGIGSGSMFDVVLSGGWIQALDVDVEEKMVYYLDSGIGKIYRAKIPNGPSELSYTQELPGIRLTQGGEIAVDWVGNNIYWTDYEVRAIYVATKDGRHRKTLLKGDSIVPAAIVVDPSKGLLFFLDVRPGSPSVQSMWMNGYHRKSLVNTDLSRPTGLAVDYHGGHRLYWSDLQFNRIESSKFDGSDRVVVTNGKNAFNPFALDVFANDMFWISRLYGKILKQDKFGRGVNVSIENNLSALYGIKIYNKYKTELFTKGINPCTFKACNMLCLLEPGGANCYCSDESKIKNITIGTCFATGVPPSSLPPPAMCRCRNGGFCRYTSETLHCQCQPNFTGKNCESPILPSDTALTVTPKNPNRPPSSSPFVNASRPSLRPANNFPSTAAPTMPKTAEGQEGLSTVDNIALIVSIVAVVVVAVLIVVITCVVRRRKLSKIKDEGRELRPGPVEDHQMRIASNPEDPVVMESSLNDPICNSDGAYANPIYEKLYDVSPPFGREGHNMAEPLPIKERI